MRAASAQFINGAMATISEALAIAVQHQQSGRLQAAEQIYRQILASQPNQPDALHLLGVIAIQAGKPAAAVEIIERAIREQGNVAFYHNNLGEAYRACSGFPQRSPATAGHWTSSPTMSRPATTWGLRLTDQGKLEEAVACCRRALQLKPDYATAHNNLGNALTEQGKLDEAVACYRRAIELNPGYAEAHSNLGIALKELGKPAEAVACCRRALELKPDYLEACNNLGNALKDQGKLDEAVDCYRRALELKPDYALAHVNLGVAYREQGKLDEAVACCRRALALKPDFAQAHYCLGDLPQGARRIWRRRSPATAGHWNSSPTMRKSTATWAMP